MKAIILNDHFVNSISKALIVVPNIKAKTIEMIFTEDGKQDLRMCLSMESARELRDTFISTIQEITIPKTVKIPKV